MFWLVVGLLLFVSCSNDAESSDSTAQTPSGKSGDGQDVDAAPESTTTPPKLTHQEAVNEAAFDGENSKADIGAAIAVLSENELSFNADKIVASIGECSQIDGGVLSGFLGEEVLVEPEASKLTLKPHVSCKLNAARDPAFVVGWLHFSPNEDGFGPSWPKGHDGEELTGLAGLGETAGWGEGTADDEFFSFLVVEEGEAQLAIEFRSYDGESNSPGKIPGMVGALSQAATDITSA